MAHARPGFVARAGDELTMRTLPAFFEVLNLLLSAGVTTVAEAAFQNHVWGPRLEPLGDLARIRVVHCVVDAEVAFNRIVRRREESPSRVAHPDPRPHDKLDHIRRHRMFDRVSVDAPWIEVDTTDGYRPGVGQIVEFINSTA